VSDFPAQQVLPVTVWTSGRYGVGGSIVREVMAGSAQLTSTAWGTANLAIYSPIWLPFRYPARNFFVYNGATLGGNLDVGIYNQDGTLIWSAGSTAQAGTSALQFFAKDILLEPGCYFLALSSNSTTATYFCNGSGSATKNRELGVLQQTSAFALPATATFAAAAQARIPLIGFTWQSGTPTF
jgi:hypothetical protein